MPTHDIDARRIALAGAAIALGVVLALIAVLLLLKLWQMPARTDRVRLPYQALLEAPPLQSAPQPDLARYRAEKQRELETTAWLDAQRGTVRIPIRTAMDLLAQRAAATASQPERSP